MHPQDATKAACAHSTGEVKWNLSEVEVPTNGHLVLEDAIEIHDIRDLGMGWAWFVNDLRALLPAWQDMELVHPFPDEPVSLIDADVPLEPNPVEGEVAEMALTLHPYEVMNGLLRPLPLAPKKRYLAGKIPTQWPPLLSLYRVILVLGSEMS